MKYLTTLLLLFSSFAHAEQFQAPITDTQWLVESSPLACSMTQEIARFGRAQFTQLPGEEFTLTFSSSLYPSQKTNIYFEIAQAPWQNSEDRLPLIALAAQKGQHKFTLSGKLAKQAFTYIKEGMFPTIRYLSQNSNEDISVLLSTVHFRDSNVNFSQCVEQLFPYTFEQIRKLTIHFNSEQSILTEDAKTALIKIADYVKIDNSIRRITVAGHTDNYGRKRINIPLARARAIAVKNFLVKENELAEKLIIISWHREFIAATTNKTTQGRSINRRTEIELIR
ncbi:MAG: cell envelope biogenesis protein OmpA [Methylophaga sp.]|nr:MAG: cell envelope biogenesis protein OmpA [Methylophaga sp.]